MIVVVVIIIGDFTETLFTCCKLTISDNHVLLTSRFQVGDAFRVDDEFNEEWYWATRESDESSGLIPVALVRDAVSLRKEKKHCSIGAGATGRTPS